MNVCLLLAAGSSSRMQGPGLTFGAGQDAIPKMLLPYKGKTLLQHAIDEIQQLPKHKLLVVTGCFHAEVIEILAPQQIEWIQNEQWSAGMGSSIQKGITYVLRHYPGAESVMVLVCDQPFISSTLLEEMWLAKIKTGKGIVACTYNDSVGTPVLFDKIYFEQLALLSGQQGAKKLVQQFAADTAMVAFPLGVVDIDTAEDYEQLNRN